MGQQAAGYPGYSSMLPEVRRSSEVYGHTAPALLGESVPIAGIAGDQQQRSSGKYAITPAWQKHLAPAALC